MISGVCLYLSIRKYLGWKMDLFPTSELASGVWGMEVLEKLFVGMTFKNIFQNSE